jgi:nicotinamide-nucleotide amidase
MAKGIREHLKATFGLSTTGIAGPDGGTPTKAVGLVYIAFASKNKSVCNEYHFRGSRDIIRKRAALAALSLLRAI